MDGSTIYQLLDDPDVGLSVNSDNAARLLVALWYVSVGIRMAAMFFVHLPPTDPRYCWMSPAAPLTLSFQPTVDRTMQALGLRAKVILFMVIAEVYAVVMRLILWFNGKLDALQQEMTIKNVLFVVAMYSAYALYDGSKKRNWNSADLGCGFHYPERYVHCLLTLYSNVLRTTR